MRAKGSSELVASRVVRGEVYLPPEGEETRKKGRKKKRKKGKFEDLKKGEGSTRPDPMGRRISFTALVPDAAISACANLAHATAELRGLQWVRGPRG